MTRNRLTPGVVGITGIHIAVVVLNPDHIALLIGDILVDRSILVECSVVGNRLGNTIGIVGEVQDIISVPHFLQLVAVVDVGVATVAVGAGCTHTVGVIGKCPNLIGVGHGRQLSAMLPSISPVAKGQRIADLIIGEGSAVVFGQQVAPVSITVGIICGIGGGSQLSGGIGILGLVLNVARIVIAPGPGLSRFLIVLPNELIGSIIGVCGGIGSVTDRQDISVIIVGVGIGERAVIRHNGMGGDCS